MHPPVRFIKILKQDALQNTVLWFYLTTALQTIQPLMPICSLTLNFSWREFARARSE